MGSLDNTESPKGRHPHLEGVVALTAMRCHHIIDSALLIALILRSCTSIQSKCFIHQQKGLDYDYSYGINVSDDDRRWSNWDKRGMILLEVATWDSPTHPHTPIASSH